MFKVEHTSATKRIFPDFRFLRINPSCPECYLPMKVRCLESKITCSFCDNKTTSSIEGCFCKELRSQTFGRPPNGPRMILSEDYQHELFYQKQSCRKCNTFSTSTSPKCLASVEESHLATIPLTFLKKTIVTDSLRRFVRRHAKRFKTMELFGRCLKRFI